MVALPILSFGKKRRQRTTPNIDIEETTKVKATAAMIVLAYHLVHLPKGRKEEE